MKRNSPPLSKEAAEWLVRLSVDDPREQAQVRAEYEAWKQANPEQAPTVQRLEGLLARMQRLRECNVVHPARVALDAALQQQGNKKARSLGTVMALAVLLVLPFMATLLNYSPTYLLADLKTEVGQWKNTRLPDGSRVALAGHSAVNVRYNGQQRELELVAGQILVDVAADPARPFVVTTPEGSIQALGTRFTVAREEGATVLTMLESRVWVRPERSGLNTGAGLVVVAGQKIRFSGAGFDAVQAVDVKSMDSAWRNHQLVVQDLPLGQVLAMLDHNRRGHIDYSAAELADLRVTAVLPLDDTDKALQLLQLLFPSLEVNNYTPYWVRVRQQEKNRPDQL